MIKTFTSLCLATIAGLMPLSGKVAVVPAPLSVQENPGTFVFQKEETISIPGYTGDSIASVFSIMSPALEKASGSKLVSAKDGRIALKLDKSLGKEAYRLNVTQDSIVLKASAPVGFFHGMQTMLQLLPVAADTTATVVGAVAIEDEPRFGWRGFMLDEGRHFFGKEAAKRVIDMMALYKMNRFHWHLTEDQGWRIEIKAYPKLTEVGSKRKGQRIGWWGHHLPDEYNYGPYYYTQDEIKEVVDYARERFIEVVPEIDLPGHTQAAVASYPELLACDPDSVHLVWDYAGVTPDVINVAKPEAVKFTTDILDELAELFPFGYIHLGGDECPTTKWEKSPECQARLKEIGSDKYRDLQLDYYNKLVRHMESKGNNRKLIFWNEALHGNTDLIGKDNNDIVIMSWVDFEKAAQDALSRGMWTIMTPIIPYYINRKQSPALNEPMGAGAGTETLKAVYAYEPLGHAPKGKEDRYMGVQGNFWTEWVDSESLLQYLMLPRLAAIAERGWSPADTRGYSDFVGRLLEWHTPYYMSRGWNHGPVAE